MATTTDIGDGSQSGRQPEPRSAGAAAGRLARARASAFRKSRRHTWSVRTLKVVLPVLALAVFGGYGLLLQTTLKLRDRGIEIPDYKITADDLKMKNPKYFGTAKDGSRYDVRAQEAIVDLAQTGPIRLFGIDGDLTQTTGVVTKLKATRGLLDNKSGELELFDGVDIDATNGMRARLKTAHVFNKENRVVSKDPVQATLPAGKLSANTMELLTKQRAGSFVGDVKLRLVPGNEQSGRASIGIGRDAKQPLDIAAERMEFDDGKRIVVFRNSVVAQQGETSLATAMLTVEYDGKAELPGDAQKAKAAVLAAGGSDEAAARISKLAARSGVLVQAGLDRRIRADAADFDVKADSALFTGAQVEVIQGKNRLLGRRLAVNRKTGQSRLDAPAEGTLPSGRIQTTFIQTQPDGKPKTAKPEASSEGGIASFRTDPNAPMDIEADSLDVNDPVKQATYRGKVRAQQGDFIVQTAELVATYTGDTGLMATDAPAAGASGAKVQGGAQLSKVEAKSRVTVTSKDGQEAEGDSAIFDVKANTVLLIGNVSVKRGRDFVLGPRLRIDVTTGEARFENEPGSAALAPVLAPMSAPKSAQGPGGLPPVVTQPPLPAAPAPGAACPPGRQCFQGYVEDAKKAAKDKSAKVKPPADGWQPSTSPSPVYRAP